MLLWAVELQWMTDDVRNWTMAKICNARFDAVYAACCEKTDQHCYGMRDVNPAAFNYSAESMKDVTEIMMQTTNLPGEPLMVDPCSDWPRPLGGLFNLEEPAAHREY